MTISSSRVQLALNVSDLDSAVAFYSELFSTQPAKIRPGYANFSISDPPLKLVLIEGGGEPGSLNHIGVEVPAPEDVAAAHDRLDSKGLVTTTEDSVTCCYAVQDKVWVDDPDGRAWEVYTVLADSNAAGTTAPGQSDASSDAPCCSSRPDLAGAAPRA